jgi:OOP family OmpA-OmpF porin
MRFRGAMLATALFAAPLAATAQPIQGLYVGAGVGIHIPQDPKITPLSPGFGSRSVKLGEGYGFEALTSLGYGLGNGMRFEVEGDFSRTGIRHLRETPFPSVTGGHVRTFGVMGNALFDMDVGMPWLYPYVGVGAGYQWTKLADMSVIQTAGGPLRFATNDQSGAFAWQAILGASLPIPNLPGLSATVD